MMRRRVGIGSAVLLLGSVVLSANSTPAGAEGPIIEPEARQILKRMTDYLGRLERFSVDTDNMLEDVLVSGQKIQYDFAASVAIQRPDKLHVERTGDLLQQHIVYDGDFLSIYNPADGVFARTTAPADLDHLLAFARDTLDIVPPTGDMVYTNAFELLMAGVTEGFVVGKSVVGGVRCDHLAFRTPVVDWQIWIADRNEPLPYKYLLTTMDDPAHPQYLVLMSNWNVAPDFDDELFHFTEPVDATEIEFLRIDAGDSTID